MKSNNCPVNVVLKTLAIQQDVTKPNEANPKPSWCRANAHECEWFRDCLEERLSSVLFPEKVAQFRDPKCDDETHRADLHLFSTEVLQTLQDVAEDSLPIPKTGGKTACWEEVSKLRSPSYFWFQVHQVHHIMKRTRNEYHLMIRKCKKSEENMK